MKNQLKSLAASVALLAGANIYAYADEATDALATKGVEAAKKGEYSQAETIFKENLQLLEQPRYTKADRVMGVRLLLKLYLEQKKFADVEPLIKRLIAIDEEEKDTKYLILDLDIFAVTLLSQNRAAEAIAVMKQKIDLNEKLPAPGDVLADDYLKMGLIYENAGQTADCEEALRKSLAYRDKIGDVSSSDLVTNLIGLGTVCKRQEKLAEAEQFFARARALKEKVAPSSSPLPTK